MVALVVGLMLLLPKLHPAVPASLLAVIVPTADALSGGADPEALRRGIGYVIQSVGELCLSPIGLSMTTKLAPVRLTGLAMGGWFLSIAIGNNLSGIFASSVSGEGGMTVASAHAGYTFGFWALLGSGVLLFLVAPLVNRLMHGVK